MKTKLARILALSVLIAAASSAQQSDAAAANPSRAGWGAPIVGVWGVAATVVNCQTGALIRSVQAVQMYQPDGTFSEITSTGTRGSSIGYWRREQDQTYEARYFFFRCKSDESFASFARAANKITVSPDGSQFSITATIQDMTRMATCYQPDA